MVVARTFGIHKAMDHFVGKQVSETNSFLFWKCN